MKKIMILGAGIYQVPLIKTAKRLGLYTIVVSIPGNYPGFALALQPVPMYALSLLEKYAMPWDLPDFPMKQHRLQ